ncbi:MULTISPECIES: hypothetical protein [unclassified Streptomyces]|uniref:hypothetical protein n=1 Tax=unclassified Streptomyces TaxID=2593676 RepID=UPI0011CD3FBC|nr:hypothetical protein [Streptomyces sp. me109]TXS76992.1 hypothetical protein EAO69_11855 [Streptomyces sp. me109]
MSEERPITPRRISFDRERTPPHRTPDGPTATHAVDVPRLPLPERELERERLRLSDRERLRLRLRLSVRLPRHGPRLAGRVRYALRAPNRAVGSGLLAAWKEPGAAVPRRPRRSYHPSREGSPRGTFTCPARSHAARAGAIGRAAVQ